MSGLPTKLTRSRKTIKLFAYAWKGFSKHRGTQAAAAVSYWGFLSIFSLLTLAIGISGMIFRGKPDIPERMMDYVRNNLPALSITADEALRTTMRLGGIMGALGILGLFFSGTRLIDSLQSWLNFIGGKSSPSWLRTKVKSLAILAVMGTTFFLGFSGHWVISAFSAGNPLPGALTRTLSLLLSAAVQFLGFSYLYYFAPEPRPRPREVIPGALFSALLVNPIQLLLVWYYSRLGRLSIAYGPLAGVALLLLALYYGALIVLFGAELNQALKPSRKEDAPTNTGMR